ncbi:MAG: MFS transporter [Wenzhouxiangellaceae bacterium]|nr:MFS transporter [Wenzhouxiangellaceae bacterium]
MYFAQGIPQGLMSIALPAWLASQGVGASEIGSYLAVVVLPWAFKLLTGPLMDRFEYRPMGRRRPWILMAQLGLSVSFLALVLVDRPAEQVGLLMLIGFLINCFAATQDVAVDGMAIELTPVREQGRLNAFMSFGKSVGWAATAAVSGVLLGVFGLAVTAILAAAVSILFFAVMIAVRERRAEKRLPWSAGRSASDRLPGNSFADVFRGINKVLWTRTSILIMVVMLFDGLIYGYGHALMPIAAVQLFGFTTAQWSGLVAVMGLVGAGLALMAGPLIDRIGAKSMLVFVIGLVGLHALVLAQTQHLWQDTLYVRTMLSLWVMLLPVTMVAILALAMAICSSGVSATQFAIYMSMANLGNSAGSKIYGMVGEQVGWVQSYTLLAILVGGMIAILLLYRPRQAGDEDPGTGRHAPARHTVSIGTAEAGTFSSGAMPCPKCRAPMDARIVEGVEIDRCSRCRGLWFDAGELETLKASATDGVADRADQVTADSIPESLDQLDEYDCPRCGAEMKPAADPVRPDLKFEICSECDGAFLDAGEFSDLVRANRSTE